MRLAKDDAEKLFQYYLEVKGNYAFLCPRPLGLHNGLPFYKAIVEDYNNESRHDKDKEFIKIPLIAGCAYLAYRITTEEQREVEQKIAFEEMFKTALKELLHERPPI